ncbi:MAG: DUF2115 family protein [Methanocorpusculum sp.]|nr:DUF2115 family protein [Methanocorpusculum sp.]
MNLLDKSDSQARDFIYKISDDLISAESASHAAEIIGRALSKYTISDLQYIGGHIKLEVDKLPNPYKNQYRPYSTYLLDKYGEVISKFRKGKGCNFYEANDAELWKKYWEDSKLCCFQKSYDEKYSILIGNMPLRAFFYRLVFGHVMFLEKGLGHPVGLPFPGGFKVRQEGKTVYCPIRDKEKDLPEALCNYCPAEQDPEYK